MEGLNVSDPPEIEVERSWVHSGEGYEAQLVCIVHGEPAPNVSHGIVIRRNKLTVKSALPHQFEFLKYLGSVV